MNQHTTPCKECPFRRTSAPGYLGASNPMEFLETSETGQKMPCHMTIDYEDKFAVLQDQIDESPHCVGRAMHFANRAKLGSCVPNMYKNADVFNRPQEFLDHHMRGQAPTIMIVGNRVVEMA